MRLFGRFKMPVIMAGMVQKDSCTFLAVFKAGFTVGCTRAVFLRGSQAPDALHHGRYGPAGAVYGAVHKTAEIPQFQFLMVVVIPVFTQRQVPMVLVTMRFPCCWT